VSFFVPISCFSCKLFFDIPVSGLFDDSLLSAGMNIFDGSGAADFHQRHGLLKFFPLILHGHVFNSSIRITDCEAKVTSGVSDS